MDPPAALHHAFVTRFESNRQAAHWLFAQLKRKDPARSPLAQKIAKRGLKEDSVETHVGSLRNRTRLTWWRNNLEATELLAQELGLRREDLLDGAPADPHAIPCPEFPGLPPITWADGPCPLWGDGWLSDVALDRVEEPGVRRWVVAPPGWGKSLLIRWLQATPGAVAVGVTATSLSAAGAHADEAKSLVVEVEERRPNDAEASRTLQRRASSVVVLAPFEPPPGPSDENVGWDVVALQPDLRWRARLLDWIYRRLELGDRETNLDPDAVRAWLDRYDPRCERVASPGDLLALCADFDRDPDDATLAERARRWIERFGFRSLAGPARAWGDRLGNDSMSFIVSRRFQSLEQRFDRPASPATWAALVPQSAAPVKQDAAPGSDVAVAYLRDAGLLRGDSDGLSPYPRWVQHGLIHGDLERYLDDANVERWGALAADASRQPLVDGALDELSSGAFRKLLARVSSAGPPRTLAATAAVEATFAAAARRLRKTAFGIERRDLPAWHALAGLQVGTLVRHGDSGLHSPFTRRSVPGWLLDAWQYSVDVAPPAELPDHKFAWDLPGWFSPLDIRSAPSLPFPSEFEAREAELGALLGRVADAIGPGVVEPNTQHLLAPALLTAAPSKAWKLDGTHLQALSGAWKPLALETILASVPADRWPAAAARAWRLCRSAMALPTSGWSSFGVADRIVYLTQAHPRLVDRVLGALEWDVVEETIQTDGLFGGNVHTPSLAPLPRPLLRRALETWLDRPLERPTRWVEAREIVPLLDSDDLDLILGILRRADLGTSAEFVEEVWRLAPAHAEAEALSALAHGLPVACAWFEAAPREALSRLAEAVDARAEQPGWLSAWAYRRALDAGPAQERLFRWAKGLSLGVRSAR